MTRTTTKSKLPPLKLLEYAEMACPLSGMSYDLVKIKRHTMIVRLCRDGTSIFCVCNLHRIRLFCTEPNIVRSLTDGG
jgi:hypothetical protein